MARAGGRRADAVVSGRTRRVDRQRVAPELQAGQHDYEQKETDQSHFTGKAKIGSNGFTGILFYISKCGNEMSVLFSVKDADRGQMNVTADYGELQALGLGKAMVDQWIDAVS